MNIRTDHLNNIQQQEETKKSSKTVENSSAFEELLIEQLNSASSKEPHLEVPINDKATSIDPTLMMALNSSSELSSNTKSTNLDLLTEQTVSLLENWEAYSNALKQGSSSRDGWNMLTGMEQQLNSMEELLGASSQANPELQSIFDELEILTSVEKVKINRGDYL